MKNERLKLSGIMLAGILVFGTFVYAVNVQPMVRGDFDGITYDLMNFEIGRAHV